MFSVIAIEVVPDNLVKENDSISFFDAVAGRIIDGIVQEINCMDHGADIMVSCDIHETDHSISIDSIKENYTQSWVN